MSRWMLWGVIAAAAIAFSPVVLVPTDAAFGEGTAFLGQPYAAIKSQLLRWRHLPIWDPSSGGGDPLLANPLAGQWYPPTWLTYVAPTIHLGMRWVVWLHLLAAAAGAYTLGRWLGAHPLAAAFVPLGFLGNPYILVIVVHGFPAVVYALPWIAWGSAWLWRGATLDRPGYLVAAGAGLAAQVFAGTTMEMHFTVALYLVLLLGIALTRPGPWSARAWRVCWQAALVLGPAAGLAAVKLLPVLEYEPLSARHGWSLQEVESRGQNPTPADVVRSFRHFLGSGGVGVEWVNRLYLTLAACAVGALARTHPLRRSVLLWSAVLGFAVWTALANQMPIDLFGLLYYCLPGFRYSPYTGRILILTLLAFPVLAAVGASVLLRHALPARLAPQVARTRRMAALGALLVGFGVVGWPCARTIARSSHAKVAAPSQALIAALPVPPRVTVDQAGSVTLDVTLTNLAARPWPRGTSLTWRLEGSPQQATVLDRPLAPGASTTVTISRRWDLPMGVEGGTLSLALDEAAQHPLPVATLRRVRDGMTTVTPAPAATADEIAAGRAVLGPLPKEWNARLGAMTRWWSDRPFRVYGDGVTSVFPYTAVQHGFEMLEYANVSMTPHYYWLEHWTTDPAALRRIYTMLRILNLRYLLITPSYRQYLDPAQTRLVHRQADAELHELTTALPRVWVPRAAALLVGVDRDRDVNALEAKLIVYHPDFDPAAWTVFTRPLEALDDLSLDELRSFRALLLTWPYIRDVPHTTTWREIPHITALFERYRQGGGRVLPLPYAEHRYTDRAVVAASMVDQVLPAKQLSADASDAVAQLLTSVAGSPGPGAAAPAVTVEAQRPGYWRLRVDTPWLATPVVVSETYFPGWRAAIDGRPAPLYMADSVIRGVMVVGSGTHTVELRYAPRALLFGGALTVITLVVLLVVGWRRWYTTRL